MITFLLEIVKVHPMVSVYTSKLALGPL